MRQRGVEERSPKDHIPGSLLGFQRRTSLYACTPRHPSYDLVKKKSKRSQVRDSGDEEGVGLGGSASGELLCMQNARTTTQDASL